MTKILNLQFRFSIQPTIGLAIGFTKSSLGIHIICFTIEIIKRKYDSYKYNK